MAITNSSGEHLEGVQYFRKKHPVHYWMRLLAIAYVSMDYVFYGVVNFWRL